MKYSIFALLLLTACESGGQAVASSANPQAAATPQPTVTVTVTPDPITLSVPVSIASVVQCDAVRDAGDVSFRIVTFSNGDKFVRCSSADGRGSASNYLMASEDTTCRVYGNPYYVTFSGRDWTAVTRSGIVGTTSSGSFLESECVTR